MKHYHIARIAVNSGWLADTLGYEGGKIHNVNIGEEVNEIVFTIEHDDLPKVHEGNALIKIVPAILKR